MKISLDRPRPSKQDYYLAIEQFVNDTKNLNGIYSLLLFGSAVEGTLVPGRSDIDLLMILDCDVVTDKNLLLTVGDTLKKVVISRNIDIGISIYDKSVMEDKRFFTFDETFMNRFNKGKILYGKDWMKDITPYLWFHGCENNIGFSLRAIRKKLVEAPYTLSISLEQFAQDFKTSLQKMKSLVSFSVPNYIGEELSNSNLKEVISLFYDFEKFKEVRKSPEQALQYWKQGLTGYEELVKEIINKYPRDEEH